MRQWTLQELGSTVEEFDHLSVQQRNDLLDHLNRKYPPEVYREHRNRRRSALARMNNAREMVQGAKQCFPRCINSEQLSSSPRELEKCAVVFTAGGEGERLRMSLLERGFSGASLEKFTKATFALPGFSGLGTLQINLIMVSEYCRKNDIDIPVIVTTGPSGSMTAELLPEIMEQFNNFGLKNVKVLPQEERLFLTNDERIVLQEVHGQMHPITHPDETGGPIMKLKKRDPTLGKSVVAWFEQIGCQKTIIVQATALYHQAVLPKIAEAIGDHDCLGVGIIRDSFPASDPYGTFVTLETQGRSVTMIVEQDVRNDSTRTVTDTSGKHFLPFNTGFYAVKNSLLMKNDLPDFATPPKVLRSDLTKSPKTGYAATDLITLSGDAVVLTIDPSMFGVLKNVDDVATLAALGKKFGLLELCEKYTRQRK